MDSVKTKNLFYMIFVVIVSLLYGIIASAYILGFLGVYKSFLIIPLMIGLTGIVLYTFLKYDNNFSSTLNQKTSLKNNAWLSTALTFCTFLLFTGLILYPLTNWPYPSIFAELHWDAGLYHFPKAAELISTGSSWDLSISYGEYPFGYESLISFCLLLNHNGVLIGTVHTIISLFLFLSIGHLFKQKIKLPYRVLFFIIVAIFLSYLFLPNFDSNIWWIFWSQLILVGKNDIFLTAALIAVLLYTPTSSHGPFFPMGLAITSMIALSIKPNASFILLFSWLMMFFFLLYSKQFKKYLKQLILSGILILPGGLWILRNLIVQGSLFSPSILNLSEWSIISNLNNPYFYQYIPQHLYYIFAVLIISGIIAIFKRSIRFELVTTVVLLLSFMLTPASAFFGSIQEPAQIAWRFALPLLIYTLLLLLIWFEPVILVVYRWINSSNFLAIPFAILLFLFGIWGIWSQKDMLRLNPQNQIILHDQYRNSVGVNGYYSAYDYIKQNVSGSVINIENGLPYYLYDSGFTNTVTRSRPADYMVFLQTPWINEGGFPESIDQLEWLEKWSLVYADQEGMVFKRK